MTTLINHLPKTNLRDGGDGGSGEYSPSTQLTKTGYCDNRDSLYAPSKKCYKTTSF